MGSLFPRRDRNDHHQIRAENVPGNKSQHQRPRSKQKILRHSRLGQRGRETLQVQRGRVEGRREVRAAPPEALFRPSRFTQYRSALGKPTGLTLKSFLPVLTRTLAERP